MSNKLAGAKKNSKKENTGLEIACGVLEYAIMSIGIAISVLVPLYLKDGYHGVGDCKYELYKWIMIPGTIVVFFFLVLCLCQGGFSSFWQKKFHITDKFVVAFLFFTIVSAIAGGNFGACITGYKGWYMGILSMFTFGILYFLFAKGGKYYKAVLISLLATSFITYVIGILHRLMIDVIGTYYLGTSQEIADSYKNQFLSTLGQASWYSSFVCTVFPLGLSVFWFAKNKKMRIVFGIFSLVGSMTLVTQNSDSAYIAMVGFFLVLFWFSAPDPERMRRFFEVLVLFLGATRIMYLLLLIHPNDRLALDTISSFMVFSNWMWVGLLIAVALWCLTCRICERNAYPVKAMKVVRVGLLVLLFIFVIAAIVILILSAKGMVPAALAVLTEKIPYMTWSDNWGNGRGRTWAFSIQMYQDMDFIRKLFGVGPDGFAPYAYELYAGRLEEMWGSRTLTNAHNEWLNALINFGIIGTVTYMGIFVSACRQMSKVQKEEPILVGIIASVVSYMCHNLFCYQTVCCTPFVFMLMGIGVYLSNNLHLKNQMKV